MSPSSLLSWRNFDALLRGRMPTEDRVALLASWLAWQVVCASLFGASLGVYATLSRYPADPRFMAASLVKMPLLLLLTSAVTVPSLYVFGALRGLRFSAREFAAMLMVAHTILAAVLGSLAPVVAFFALTTTSYSFMVLLTVFACGIAGLLGIRVFVRALNEPAPLPKLAPLVVTDVTELLQDEPGTAIDVVPFAGSTGDPTTALSPADRQPDPWMASFEPLSSQPEAPPQTPAPAPKSTFVPQRPPAVNQGVWRLLGWWVLLYVFVGVQSGWILRPFIGHPDKPFVLFRGKSGGFIEGVLHHLWNALFGE
ncbi:MAG: hypothetical protein V4850_34755 [Myxococcota bacterium]